MQKYVLAYHGSPQLKSPEDGQKHMQQWRSWMNGLGDAVVDPGVPVGKSKTVSRAGVTNDGGSNPLSGYTVVQAQDIDEALAMAMACPHVTAGGTIEVAPVMNMDM